MAERIAEVGYINESMEHALVSIYSPALLNARENSVQVALTLGGATELHARLSAFLAQHEAAVG